MSWKKKSQLSTNMKNQKSVNVSSIVVLFFSQLFKKQKLSKMKTAGNNEAKGMWRSGIDNGSGDLEAAKCFFWSSIKPINFKKAVKV